MGQRKRKKKENVVQDQQIFSSCSSDGWMGHWTENDRTGGQSRQGKLPTDVSGLLEGEGAAMMLWLDVSYD